MNAAGGVYDASANSYVMLPQVSSKSRLNDSFNALDFRLDRTFAFGDRYTLDLLGEAFNIFNVTNILGVTNLNYRIRHFQTKTSKAWAREVRIS